jgi:hypothetical protein
MSKLGISALPRSNCSPSSSLYGERIGRFIQASAPWSRQAHPMSCLQDDQSAASYRHKVRFDLPPTVTVFLRDHPPSLVWAMLVHSCGPLEILPSLHPISILKQRPRARGPESPFRWFTQNIRSAPHPDYNQGRQIQEEDLEQEWQVVKKKWWWRHGKRSHVKSPHQLLAFGETSCSSSAWQGGTITL